MEPAPRQVEHVPRPEDEVVHGLARTAHLGGVLLVLQRQLERWLVNEPALLAGDLKHEDVVRVVVHREPLRRARRVVRVHLRGMAQRAFERAAERAELRPVEVEALQDDRRPALPFGQHAIDVGRPGEAGGTPGDVGRVVADGKLLARLDEPEPGKRSPPEVTSRSTSASERRSS